MLTTYIFHFHVFLLRLMQFIVKCPIFALTTGFIERDAVVLIYNKHAKGNIWIYCMNYKQLVLNCNQKYTLKSW